MGARAIPRRTRRAGLEGITLCVKVPARRTDCRARPRPCRQRSRGINVCSPGRRRGLFGGGGEGSSVAIALKDRTERGP